MSVPTFTQDAPITYMIDTITSLTVSALNGVTVAVSDIIAPLAGVVFGIYVIFITLNYMRGAEAEPIQDLMVRIFYWSLIIGFGLNAHATNYINDILPIVTGIGGDLASAVSGGSNTKNSLDSLAISYLDIIQSGFTAAASYDGFEYIGQMLFVLLKSLVIIFTLAPFLIAAALALTIANIGALIVASIGPIFFAFLLFPATRQYFSAWINTLFAYALIPLLVAVIAMVGVGISAALIAPTGGGAGQTLVDVPFSQVVYAGIGNLILLFALKHVSSLASSLSAGGINMGNAGGVGSLASAIRSSGRGTAQDLKSLGKAKDSAMGAYEKMKEKFSKNSMRKGA